MNTSGVMPTIMVLDDEPSIQNVLKTRLERTGYKVLVVSNYADFTETMVDCDVVLCDIIMPASNGLEALKWVRQHYPHTAVIMMTGKPSYETAAEAIRLGAYDYLIKPIETEDLLHTLDRAIQHRQLALEKERLETENEAYRLILEQQVADQTEALRESQEFLSTLTNTMADAVLSLKMPEHRIEYVNQAVTEIFGYQPEELLGQTIEILFADPSKFDVFNQKQHEAIIKTQTEVRLEETMCRKDGEAIWTEMVATFINSDDGQPSQMIAVIRDITQRSFLLGVVAHELRGPLALLTGFLQTMLDDIENLDQESIKAYLGTMSESATRMFQMVDELLDITKIELGDVSLQIEPVDLKELIRTYKNDYAYLARKKDIALIETFSSDVLVCECDPGKIGQVIANFIDNAIKYSTPGATVELVGKQQGDALWIGVKDEGAGIRSEELEHLFTDFGHTKISSKPTAGEKSTGLGLAICKKIIEAHQGQVGADSTPNQGSTFWFSLPAERKNHLN